jgi:hypothetical protein
MQLTTDTIDTEEKIKAIEEILSGKGTSYRKEAARRRALRSYYTAKYRDLVTAVNTELLKGSPNMLTHEGQIAHVAIAFGATLESFVKKFPNSHSIWHWEAD